MSKFWGGRGGERWEVGFVGFLCRGGVGFPLSLASTFPLSPPERSTEEGVKPSWHLLVSRGRERPRDGVHFRHLLLHGRRLPRSLLASFLGGQCFWI